MKVALSDKISHCFRSKCVTPDSSPKHEYFFDVVSARTTMTFAASELKASQPGGLGVHSVSPQSAIKITRGDILKRS